MLQEGSQKPITVIVEVNLVYTNDQTSFNTSAIYTPNHGIEIKTSTFFFALIMD